MNVIRYPEKSSWTALLKRPVLMGKDVDTIVSPIIQDVQKRGDSALFDYTEKFDHVRLSSLQVTMEEFLEAHNASG